MLASYQGDLGVAATSPQPVGGHGGLAHRVEVDPGMIAGSFGEMRDNGLVFVNGELWQARTEGGHRESGKRAEDDGWAPKAVADAAQEAKDTVD